jgi:hypothetical protein
MSSRSTISLRARQKVQLKRPDAHPLPEELRAPGLAELIANALNRIYPPIRLLGSRGRCEHSGAIALALPSEAGGRRKNKVVGMQARDRGVFQQDGVVTILV